jgi:hypothetical protein
MTDSSERVAGVRTMGGLRGFEVYPVVDSVGSLEETR